MWARLENKLPPIVIYFWRAANLVRQANMFELFASDCTMKCKKKGSYNNTENLYFFYSNTRSSFYVRWFLVLCFEDCYVRLTKTWRGLHLCIFVTPPAFVVMQCQPTQSLQHHATLKLVSSYRRNLYVTVKIRVGNYLFPLVIQKLTLM